MARLKDTFLKVFGALKLISVEPYLFFCLFGYTVRQVTFQNLLMDSACRNLHLYSDDICNALDNHTYHQASSIEAGNNLYAAVMLISSLPAIVVAVFLGPWSDKYSRKYPLVISATGMMVEGAVSAALTFYPKTSPLWYIAASISSGFSGGFIMSYSGAFSYISDVTEERSRSARYAILEFSNISAIVLGSVLGGTIFQAGGYLPVMIIGPCSFGSAILYALFVVKETKTRTPDQTCSVMVKDLFTVDNIKESYKTCSRKRPGNIRLQIWLLVWVGCSLQFMEMGILSVSFPFARGMYKWDVAEFSRASAAFYVLNAFATIAIVPILSNKLRLHEAVLGLIGILSLMAQLVLISVAYKEPIYYYAWIIGALHNSAVIAVRSRLSKLVNKNELGRAFSLLGTCESVAPLLGTLAFVQMYNASALVFPGLPFAVSAIFLIPSLFVFGWMTALPTISLGDYDSDSISSSKPTKTSSSNYVTLREEKF